MPLRQQPDVVGSRRIGKTWILADTNFNNPAPSLKCDCFLASRFSFHWNFTFGCRAKIRRNRVDSHWYATAQRCLCNFTTVEDGPKGTLISTCPPHLCEGQHHTNGYGTTFPSCSSTATYILVYVRESLNLRQEKNCKNGVTDMSTGSWPRESSEGERGYGTKDVASGCVFLGCGGDDSRTESFGRAAWKRVVSDGVDALCSGRDWFSGKGA